MAQPIPVLRRAPRKRDDAPSAPVIAGSLVEDNLLNSLPELSLPAGTPEAFSLAEIATAEYTERLMGVSSAPARTFIEAARRAGVQPGTSPTVLSILQSKGADAYARGHALGGAPGQRGGLPPPGAPAPAPGAAGDAAQPLLGRNSDVDSLAAGLTRFSLAVGSLPTPSLLGSRAAAAAAAGRAALLPAADAPAAHAPGGVAAALRTGSGGAPPVVLATSFRDASLMPPPLLPSTTEEGDEAREEESEDEGERVRRLRRVGAGGRGGAPPPPPGAGAAGARGAPRGGAAGGGGGGGEEEDEEEDEAAAARRRAERDTEGVFDESDL